MGQPGFPLLTLIIFFPLLGAVILLFACPLHQSAYCHNQTPTQTPSTATFKIDANLADLPDCEGEALGVTDVWWFCHLRWTVAN